MRRGWGLKRMEKKNVIESWKKARGKKLYFKKPNFWGALSYRSRVCLQPFAGNYSHDKWYERSEYFCRCREFRESESHLMACQCNIYDDIRKIMTTSPAMRIGLIFSKKCLRGGTSLTRRQTINSNIIIS